MDTLGTILFVGIMGSMVVLPLIWIRLRVDKESRQFQERPSQDYSGTPEYYEGEQYMKVLRYDKETFDEDRKKKNN